MASKANCQKRKLFTLSLLSLTLSLLVLISTFLLKSPPTIVHPDETSQWWINNPIIDRKKRSPPFSFLAKEFEGREMKIGLVNIHEEEEEEEEAWEALGETSLVHFDRVAVELQWEDFFPEWIDEEEKWGSPTCPEIPMPRFEEYGEFDVVISRVPCGNLVEKQGIRDVFRLQVNLVIANLVARSGQKNGDDDRPVYVVFIGSCGPMWEIFRCDDLLIHDREFWVYKPDLRRLKQKLLMPVGTCQLALPNAKQGEGKINYDFSKLSNPIDNPREAYVTILHSSQAYVCGAIALAQSIIQTNSTKDLVLLADKSITLESQRALKAAGWKIKHIERIRSRHAKRNAYNEWNYSKLRIWQLTEYDKIIFIDSDLIILKNIDDFFIYPQLSAVRNDKVLFNSGLLSIEPSNCMFEMLMEKTHTLDSYNGGDQGFLNEVFTWWHRWPVRLNFLKIFVNETEHEIPESLYAIHYLGLKPWMCYRDYDCNWDMLNRHPFASDSAHRRWWQVYDAMPKRLRGFCALSKKMDARIKKWRRRAQNASLPDGHWKMKVKDPRQHYH